MCRLEPQAEFSAQEVEFQFQGILVGPTSTFAFLDLMMNHIRTWIFFSAPLRSLFFLTICSPLYSVVEIFPPSLPEVFPHRSRIEPDESLSAFAEPLNRSTSFNLVSSSTVLLSWPIMVKFTFNSPCPGQIRLTKALTGYRTYIAACYYSRFLIALRQPSYSPAKTEISTTNRASGRPVSNILLYLSKLTNMNLKSLARAICFTFDKRLLLQLEVASEGERNVEPIPITRSF